MTDDVLPNLSLQVAPAPQRDRRFAVTAVLSVLAHLLVFAAIVLLPLLKLPPPEPPPAISVELVPPAEAPSLEPSSEPPSSEPASSPEPASSEPPSSAETTSSELPSAASSEPPASSPQPVSSAEAPASAEQAPVPQQRPAPRLVIPVGPEAASSEAGASASAAISSEDPSTAASGEEDAPSVLGAENGGAAGEAEPGTDAAAAAPAIDGPLHIASKFFAGTMLRAPGMAAAREAIRKLPRARRIVQMCNLEAVGQIGSSARHLQPDAVVANAFAPPVAAGLDYNVSGGAFRADENWYALSFSCSVAEDLASVTAFSFRIGEPLPGPPTRPVPPPRPAGG